MKGVPTMDLDAEGFARTCGRFAESISSRKMRDGGEKHVVYLGYML